MPRRKDQPNKSGKENGRRNRSNKSYDGDGLRPADRVARYGNLRRLAFTRTPPPLRTFADAIGEPTSQVHGCASDKRAFARLQAELRAALEYPVTQLGTFATLVRFAEERADEFAAFAQDLVEGREG